MKFKLILSLLFVFGLNAMESIKEIEEKVTKNFIDCVQRSYDEDFAPSGKNITNWANTVLQFKLETCLMQYKRNLKKIDKAIDKANDNTK